MFKIGDKVRITKPFLENDVLGFNPAMHNQVGKFGTIAEIQDGGQDYRVDLDAGDAGRGYYWLSESLEHVNTLHVGDVVEIANPDWYYRINQVIDATHADVVAINKKTGKLGIAFAGTHTIGAKVIQKYPLRNAKGHYIKCDRYVNPLEAAVKRRKPVAKGVVAEAAPKAAIMAKKALPAPPKIKDIRSELAKLAKAGYDGNRCNYSIEFDNGKIRHQAPDACHARLCWSNYADEDSGAKAIVNIALNVSAHYKELSGANRKVYPLFVKYILNDSPWAFCFITKDVDEALEKGILMDVQQNVSHIVGAAMSLRLGTEYPDTLKPFADALEKGYSGNVAHLVSGHLMGGVVTSWPNHSALTSGLGIKAIAKFFKEGYTEKLPAIAKDRKQTSYQVFGTISPGCKYGNCANDDTSLSIFTRACAVSTKVGEGFDAKTTFNYEATLIRMADAFTRELT